MKQLGTNKSRISCCNPKANELCKKSNEIGKDFLEKKVSEAATGRVL